MELHYGITDSKPWGWSKRQASRHMSFSHADFYSSELEYPMAVAAAAYAITTLERTRSHSHSQPTMASRPYYRDEESRRNSHGKVDRSGSTLAEKIIRQVPSMKRTPTFSGSKRYSEEIQSQKPETETRIPSFVPPPQQQQQPIQFGGANKSSRVQESEADDWERAQLDKIKQRHGELGKRRAKALQSYQDDIERIRQVADGARSQARDKRRKEEMKVNEKANKLRTTGQLPTKCFCF
ncbi:hypothetical protein V2J09_012953 [Rumex salicifolius]